MAISSIEELVVSAEKAGKSIGEYTLQNEAALSGRNEREVYEEMAERLRIMKEAADFGFSKTKRTASGLAGGDAAKVQGAIQEGKIPQNIYTRAIAIAIAVAECNAKMGKIVAAPTAGSCGVLPGVILPAMELEGISGRKAVLGLFCAGAMGSVIAKRASLSGAECGCQAECGSAAGMAAAALCEMKGGTPRQAAHALAIAIKGLLGLVCDPVAGIVECPCVKRNADSAVHALAAAHMVLAGLESMVPADEVLDAMKHIGRCMSPTLKETSEGGLACTLSGRAKAEELTKNWETTRKH
jgi:L-serine dehydratase